jgi:hypothetical protein
VLFIFAHRRGACGELVEPLKNEKNFLLTPERRILNYEAVSQLFRKNYGNYY